jgi:hypothetical protein
MLIWQDLLCLLQKYGVLDLKPSDTCFKVGFTLPDSQVQAKFSLSRVNSSTVCVDLTRKCGDQFAFFEWF